MRLVKQCFYMARIKYRHVFRPDFGPRQCLYYWTSLAPSLDKRRSTSLFLSSLVSTLRASTLDPQRLSYKPQIRRPQLNKPQLNQFLNSTNFNSATSQGFKLIELSSRAASKMGPMRKRALHFLNIISSSYRILSL